MDNIFTPPTFPPSLMNDTPWSVAMPIAQKAMDSFSHEVPQLGVQPQNEASRGSGRVLILCFDGTGNSIGDVGVNIYFQRPSMPNLFAESMRI